MKGIEIRGCRQQALAVLLLLASILIAGWAYAPGIGGSFHFDDPHNLHGLSQVTDLPSALEFAITGTAGPTGRPLALLSFVPQAYAWPHSPEVFLYTNILLHLLNGVLVAWLLYLVGLASNKGFRDAAWIAAASSAVWMLLPILASSSLLIVQRMTTLSTTFLLLGFIGYLYSRALMRQQPKLALLLMTLSVLLGTTLSVFTKENGVLLPLFILVAEKTILSRPTEASALATHRAWSTAMLGGPAVVLLAYVILQANYSEATLLIRDYTASDRLLTQAQVLWKYLYTAFLPATSALGPFHDDFPLERTWTSPLALLSVTGWLGAVVAMFMFRQRLPLLSFAIGWYLCGHLLESTTIPLELYFEHRNYAPLIGPVFALVIGISQAPPQWAKLFRGALVAYAALMTVVLTNTTTLWGQPMLAAEMWSIYHPTSTRGVLYLSEQLQRTGDFPAARRVLRRHMENSPDSPTVALQTLALSCNLRTESTINEEITHLEDLLPKARFEYGAFEALTNLTRLAREDACDGVDGDVVYKLASELADNPIYRANTIARHNLHILMAEYGIERRDLDLTMQHIESALSSSYAITTLAFAVDVLESAGLRSEARDFITQAKTHSPSNPLRALVWKRQLSALQRSFSMD